MHFQPLTGCWLGEFFFPVTHLMPVSDKVAWEKHLQICTCQRWSAFQLPPSFLQVKNQLLLEYAKDKAIKKTFPNEKGEIHHFLMFWFFSNFSIISPTTPTPKRHLQLTSQFKAWRAPNKNRFPAPYPVFNHLPRGHDTLGTSQLPCFHHWAYLFGNFRCCHGGELCLVGYWRCSSLKSFWWIFVGSTNFLLVGFQ